MELKTVSEIVHEIKDKVLETAREAKDKVIETTRQTKGAIDGDCGKGKEEQWCGNSERHSRDGLVSYSEQWFWSMHQMLQDFNLLLSFFMVLFNSLYFEPKATKVMLERIEWKRKKEEGEIIAFSRIAVMFVGLGEAGDDVRASTGTKDRRGCGGGSREGGDKLSPRGMMLKFFAGFIAFLCTTALSCGKVEGFPILKSQDSYPSKSVAQGHDIHDAGLNRTVNSKSEAKGNDRDEYYKQQYHEIFESDKAKSGKGAYGGANVPHHRQGKNAAPSLVSPPCFLLTATLHVILTVTLSLPGLLPKLF
ncbi:hypothetical protein J1N35_031587 [Gossypium stocksii]|uniref:Uncharacterized protein n=1 Tax=Gossypium stocksii TaxID=47602 RepID=A0A9D3V1G1_9ROSI|nr:hypothetical protein J1N35_031587 [Gossypium stocksii]